tara:strand:- start:52 stop:456 length:405 start_codon:yes stop_codon:yes gene_type:complete
MGIQVGEVMLQAHVPERLALFLVGGKNAKEISYRERKCMKAKELHREAVEKFFAEHENEGYEILMPPRIARSKTININVLESDKRRFDELIKKHEKETGMKYSCAIFLYTALANYYAQARTELGLDVDIPLQNL